MNFLDDIQPCPICERFCNREHFAIEFVGRGSDAAITYLYCEDCGQGWESLWKKVDGRWKVELSVHYTRDNIDALIKFKERLRQTATVAA